MTRVRRAGARWRVRVHEWVGQNSETGCTYGTAYDMSSDPRDQGERATVLPGTEFDEVVVGSWLHLEQMDTGLWWANVGGVTVNVRADRDGRPTLVQVFGPGDYADPVEGCAYELVWSGSNGGAPDSAPVAPNEALDRGGDEPVAGRVRGEGRG